MEGATTVLDRRASLKEMLDPAAFTEVCRSFVDLYGIGIKVFAADGARLVDLRAGNADFCGYVFSLPAGQQRCTAMVARVKGAGDEDCEIRAFTCFTGLRYLVLPIVHEMDVLGRVILGPFRPDDLSHLPEELSELGSEYDAVKASALVKAVRGAPEATVRRILEHLRLIIDVIVHSGYKTLLTSSMHIESITAAHRELVDRNKKLEESLEKLRELDRLKSNFLATVSHELRTPLTSVIGYSEMLLEGLVGEMTAEQKEYVATIFEKGESLLDLIGSILDISRIESGRLTLSKVDLNLSELADSAISTVKPQAQKKRLELHCEIEPEIPPVTGDRDKVRQCMVNLLANAVKFTPEGGRIDLKVEHYHGSRRAPPANRRDEAGYTLFEMMDEDFVRISVKDSGIGIADDQKERIFDSFYQVDSSSTRAYGGTGLGLSIVKSYMEAHEGEVWVDSLPGEGSTFALLLPARRQGAEAVQSAAGAR